MKLKFEIEVDLTEAMLNNDSQPFDGFSSDDYEKYIKEELLQKMSEINMYCGAEIEIKDEEGKLYIKPIKLKL